LATAPILIATDKGWLKDAGLAPAVTTFESGPNMIQALASGTLDVYVAGIAPLAVARARGLNIKVLAATAIEENVFVAGPKLSPFFAEAENAAAAFKRFRAQTGAPARLATQPLGSVPNTTLQYWLWEVAKVDRADAVVVPMGIDATQQAVAAGAVEGGIMREPAVTIVTARDPAIRLVARGGEMFPNQPGTVLAVTESFIDRHPQAVQAIVDGVVRAVGVLQKEPETLAPVLQQSLGRGLVDEATLRRALVSPASKFIADPRVIVDSTAAMQRYQVALGALEREESLDGLFDPRWFDQAATKF
jgi:NitT/TauT family transport system substrate-binding protein